MAAIDLRGIFFRSFQPETGAPAPISAPSSPIAGAVNLSSIKIRSSQVEA